MKILCAYSGIEFTCDHFPASLYARESYHPIFNIPQKKLLGYIGKWGAGELTPTDSYLLFLSILKSTDLVNFRVPAIRTTNTDSIIALNMESLVRTVIKLNAVTSPSVVFPQYVISPETKGLENVRYWIENWMEAYKDYQDGYKSAHESSKLIHRENALERLIKNPHKPISSYSTQLAEWAALAGKFPTFVIQSPFNQSQTITCADYWKLLISKCAREESIFSVRRTDIQELLEHCEDNIPVGSIYSNALFKILRHAIERQKNFLGLGDFDLSKSTYSLLTDEDSVESANLKAMVESAPEYEPKPESYPSKFLYMKAKLRWDMAKKAGER